MGNLFESLLTAQWFKLTASDSAVIEPDGAIQLTAVPRDC